MLGPLNVPKKVLIPALLKDGQSYSIVERDELAEMCGRYEARRMPGENVALRWQDGKTENRTLRAAELRNIAGVRGFSARMSPPDPSHTGKIDLNGPYYNFFDALASNAKGEFAEQALATLQMWKSARHAVLGIPKC